MNKLSIVEIARVCHEANRAYCQSLGDYSQLPWHAAPKWQRLSVFDGILFHRDNPDALPEASHENWLREKEADGWTYGPIKDPDLKQHPCCVCYSALPPEQKAKDYIFAAIVKQLL